jgi:hypothetical protein
MKKYYRLNIPEPSNCIDGATVDVMMDDVITVLDTLSTNDVMLVFMLLLGVIDDVFIPLSFLRLA